MEQMQIQKFKPDVFIEIDDSFTGVRKLARVIGDGDLYLDLDSDDATPLPIYSALNPQEAGNILGWGLYLVDQHPDEHAKFRALVDRLLATDMGTLERNRAAHWAFLNHNYDFAAAVSAATVQTKAVMEGRAKMDRLLQSSGVAN